MRPFLRRADLVACRLSTLSCGGSGLPRSDHTPRAAISSLNSTGAVLLATSHYAPSAGNLGKSPANHGLLFWFGYDDSAGYCLICGGLSSLFAFFATLWTARQVSRETPNISSYAYFHWLF